ncbi:MAG: SRPBCC family protein [Acidimicrobiales bacterium]|nr:SRPBCC family protein [Acidimicrobiales bacterium]
MANHRSVSVSRVIEAAPEVIFAIIDDPSKHASFDGSGTVKGSRQPEQHVKLGDRFGMNMRMGIPYRIASKVVEYEANRLLAWAHFGGHRWRYELEPLDGGARTRVTETFDWSTSKFPPFIELMKYPAKHVPNMERTLERLSELVTRP